MPEQTPIPYNEKHRLAALRAYQVLDTTPEAAFDRLTRLVARHFNVPTVLVSLIDEARQWFKSRVGLDARETPRALAFCAHAILGHRPLVVCDARDDPRFRDNALVTGAPHIRFYAGAPLITASGFRLGTLCLIDDKPWLGFSPTQEEDLTAFADIVMERLETRRRGLSEADDVPEPAVADAALEDVMAHLAHEIMTPLAAIVGHAEVIERRHGGDGAPDPSRIDARQIGEIGGYLCDLAQRVLDAASLRDGDVALQEDWLDLSDIAAGVRQLLARPADGATVAVNLTGDGLSVELHADRLRLQQMLLNLLGNAVKFTPAGGEVCLRARRNAEGGLDLTVSDNGPGMSFDEARRALQPFGRIRRDGDAKVEGFGLGLPMTRRLIELHGGRLLIDSVRGRGTAVTLRFPSYRLRWDDAAATAVETIRIEPPRHMAV